MLTSLSLHDISDVAEISTAIVGIGAYAWYQLAALLRRRALEAFLKSEETQRSQDRAGLRTVLYLASQLRMTEAEILEAGFKSRKIKSVAGFDKVTGRADVILFEYDRKGVNSTPAKPKSA
jgi:hypothetical protein